MSIPKRTFQYFSVIGAGLALLLTSGCVTIPAASYTNIVAYEPVRSPVQIDASATVEAVVTMAPEMEAFWKRTMNSDTNIANYLNAVAQVLRNDLGTSGLFARIVTDNPAQATYLVQARGLESHPSDYRFTLTLTATETATGTQISSHRREISLGDSAMTYAAKRKEALPSLMAALKAELAADLGARARRQQEQADRELAATFAKASLADLLGSSDQSVDLARERNRALVAAKNQQLPAILRDRKTDELSALVVRIEQTILDLNHESEVAKDQAQQSVAGDGSPRAARTRSVTFLGVSMDRLSAEKAPSLGFEPGTPVVIALDVVPDGPAAKAGLQRDDAILSINDQSVTSPDGLRTLVQSFPPNAEVTVKYRRAKIESTTKALLEARTVPVTEARPQSLDELRGLAISYRERIELLKPILTAIKEEIANRGR